MAAPTFSNIKDALYDWVFGLVTPKRVIWNNQNVPRPVFPYLTLHVSPAAQIAQDYMYSPGTTGVSLICGNREFTLMIQYFGAGGYDTMESLGSSLEAPSVQQFLSGKGIAIVRRLPTIDITGLVDTRYEERYAMDVQFRTYSEFLDTVGLIESVKVKATYKELSETVIEEELFINPVT
jgi:hypothetical protein